MGLIGGGLIGRIFEMTLKRIRWPEVSERSIDVYQRGAGEGSFS